jgi:DNA-3-methyladenine glycosylase
MSSKKTRHSSIVTRRKSRPKPLPHAFYARDTEIVARELLGCLLVSTVGGARVSGRIVETEAYLGPHDPASHAAERIGRTRRNTSMFAAPGTAYVYRIYGVHWCLNAVTMRIDYPSAVLIRALEPVDGSEVMRRRRWPNVPPGADRLIASGPGKLATALAITGELDGHDLVQPPLFIEPGEPVADTNVSVGPRIGITQAADWPLRFCVANSQWVSKR